MLKESRSEVRDKLKKLRYRIGIEGYHPLCSISKVYSIKEYNRVGGFNRIATQMRRTLARRLGIPERFIEVSCSPERDIRRKIIKYHCYSHFVDPIRYNPEPGKPTNPRAVGLITLAVAVGLIWLISKNQ